ncbi:MAG: FtsQ-type POTRA domain-containing protein [FCB group bacterium]|jgi:cell division protein FtsQ|nr:FtsQ-type POTRA domain-containing protein [FCB group bacterium]
MTLRRKARKQSAFRRLVAFTGRVLGWTLKAVLFVGFLCGLGYGIVSFASKSDHFHVKTIRVEGMSVLDEATVRDACGITQEDNLIFLRAADVRKRVEDIPYVRDCTVTCVFPDTVVIKITERVAVATLLVRNRFYAVDTEGRILQQLAIDGDHPGPLITGPPDLNEVVPGQTLTFPSYPEALAVWAAFNKTQAAQALHLSEIAATAENDIQLFFDDAPYKLNWGRGNYEMQAKRLDVLWAAKGGKLDCTQYLDLRFAEDLVCK